MKHSNEIQDIAAALAKAQGAMGKVVKGNMNPHFRSKYADLAAVSDAARSALSENGIAVFQSVETSETGAYSLVTLLTHSSGQWITGEVPLLLSKQDMQGLGSGMTYARRYGLLAVCNLAPEDDDGNAASGGVAVISGSQVKALQSLLSIKGVALDKFLLAYNAQSLEAFPALQFDDAMNRLKAKPDAQEAA